MEVHWALSAGRAANQLPTFNNNHIIDLVDFYIHVAIITTFPRLSWDLKESELRLISNFDETALIQSQSKE